MDMTWTLHLALLILVMNVCTSIGTDKATVKMKEDGNSSSLMDIPMWDFGEAVERANALKKQLDTVRKIKEADCKASEILMDNGNITTAEFDSALLHKEQAIIDRAHQGAGDELMANSDTAHGRHQHHHIAQSSVHHVIKTLELRKREHKLPSELGVLLDRLTENHYKPTAEKKITKRKMETSGLWNQGIIPYVYDHIHKFENQVEVEAQVEVAMRLWQEDTCLQFVHWNPDISAHLGHGDYLKFQSAKHCAAIVGRYQPGQFVGLDVNGCGVSGAAHEIGHAIGLHHENVRDDRDNYLIYQCWNNADPLDMNVAAKKEWPQVSNLAKYDFMSIMQYGANSDQTATLAVKNPALLWMGNLGHLPDFYDKSVVSQKYNCHGHCNKDACKNDGYMLEGHMGCQCKCPNGLGGEYCAEIDKDYGCGKVIQLAANGSSVNISSPLFPSPYQSGHKCAWLLTAPKGMVVQMKMKRFRLPENETAPTACLHWLEVRNNLLGQIGRKYCGSQWLIGTIDSRVDFNNNQMLLIFNATDLSVTGGHGFKLEANAYKDACLTNPCQGAPCTPSSGGGYTCNFRKRSFQCKFNQGCLCYFTVHEDVYPADHKNWKATDIDAYEGGYSIMAETNKYSKKTSDTAVLRTIPIGFDACVSFAYRIKGGKLQVRVYDNGKPSCRLLTTDGPTNGWLVETFKVTRNPKAYSPNNVIQVGFIASASGTAGHIFLDDIKVNKIGPRGKCVVDACFTNPCHGYQCKDVNGKHHCNYPGDVLWTCDFEVKSPCHGLKNYHTSHTYQWVIAHGPTRSTGTGPAEGADGGRYMYLEASGRSKGNQFIMRLEIPFPGDRCLRFKYNMLGSGIGSLNIYHVKGGVKGNAIWTKSGDQGRDWLNAEANTKGPGEIWFVGIAGSTFQGDISVDMIEYHPVPCKSLPPVAEVTALPLLGKYSCGFKDMALCSLMIQSSKADFSWSFRDIPTPTRGTGPSAGVDGKDDGYAYIEASFKEPRKKAILEFSPQFFDGPFCFSFNYHMYGRQTGSLTIYYYRDRAGKKVWGLEGEQGNKWKNASINIDFIKGAKIVIEGVRGPSSRSDIAIDNIVMTPEHCSHGLQPAKAAYDPDIYKCGFEFDEMCAGMYLDTTLPKKWFTYSGPTPSRNTGPFAAAKQNYYLYLEASYGHAGENAVLTISSQHLTPGPRCLLFKYHMYGSTMGYLNVYLLSGHSSRELWSMSLNQGKSWHQACVNIPDWKCKDKSHNCDKLKIEAVKGVSITGDIAIDDVVFQPGPCLQGTLPKDAIHDPELYKCDFELGRLCKGMKELPTELSWSFTGRNTPTSSTGPSKAASGTYYTFIEASYAVEGDKAIMAIDKDFETGLRCLRFYYHMYGSGMDTAQLNVKVTGGALLFKQKSDHGKLWQKAAITVNHIQSQQVIFEAVRGSSSRSDIALDGIIYSRGAC